MPDWHRSPREQYDVSGLFPGSIVAVIYDEDARLIGIVVRGGGVHLLIEMGAPAAGHLMADVMGALDAINGMVPHGG